MDELCSRAPLGKEELHQDLKSIPTALVSLLTVLLSGSLRFAGDALAHSCGVSSEPELTEHAVTGSDLFVVVASDGVWDVIESAQAVQIVAGHLARATAQGGPLAPWDPRDAAKVSAPHNKGAISGSLCLLLLL